MSKEEYGNVDKDLIKELEEVCGKDYVITNESQMEDYKCDETAISEVSGEYPNVLVKPGSTGEVSEIMRLANKRKVPVTPMGGRTGITGGTIPVYGGIGLSMERINTINMDPDNLMVEAGGGVPMEDLYEAIEEEGLALPIHPTTEDSQVGGTVANNAGGESTLKHGVMRDYVKGLEVVTPTGKTLDLGGKLLKDNTGYSLLDLIIGSEGTLGVITKAVLRLQPPSSKPKIVTIPFNSRKKAIEAVPEIVRSGIIPQGIEYLEKEPLKKGEEEMGEKWPAEKGEASLMVMVSGEEEDRILERAQSVMDICEEKGAKDAFLATEKRDEERVMSVRQGMAEVVIGSQEGLEKKSYWVGDYVVPPKRIPEFLEKAENVMEEIEPKAQFYTFGHAGDGNVHTFARVPDTVSKEEALKIREKWIELAVDLGGAVTAEHGIGIVKKRDLRKFCDEEELRLMRDIKESFDPNMIMNPGKIVPETKEVEEKYVKI